MAEIYVTSTADSGAGSLRQAIADAQDGDVILFDSDVFPVGQTTTILLSSLITTSKAISLYGGFPDGQGGYTSGTTITRYVVREIDGVETEVVVDDDHPAAEGEVVLMHVTTRVALDGQATQDPDAADEWSGWTGTRLFSFPSPTVATIAGIAFINGLSTASESPPFLHLEGTNEDHGDYTVTDCSFKNGINTAGYCGGVRIRRALARFESCEFDNCKAKAYGGAIYAPYTIMATLDSCVITNCSASSGGGLFLSGTSQNTLNDCTISGCTATTNGGGLFLSGTSQNTLNDCTITGCSANNGGGVYARDTSINILNDCTIDGCSVTNAGGALYTQSSSEQNNLCNCIIHNCSAKIGAGVAIYSTGVAGLNNCSIYDCAASDRGGAIFVTNTAIGTVENCELVSSVFLSSSSSLVSKSSRFNQLDYGSNGTVEIDGGVTTVNELSLGSRTITIADGAALTITTAATITTATFTSEGRGYLAVAPGIDTSAATLDGVVLCSYGAGLESFSARETTRTEIKLDWTQTDDEIPVLVEQKVGNSWETVVESTAGTYNVTVEPATRHLFRAFDGVSFHVDAAWHGIEAPQFKVVGIIVEADAQDVNWQAITEVVNVDGAVRSGQSITILARIYDAYDNETVLLNETGNIVSVVYTLEKRSKSLFDYTWTPVEGHNEVEVSSECVLEDLQTSDAWTVDDDGYSFVLTPDTTEHTLFATPGVYRFRVKITLAEGNPVVFYEEINVVDE